MKGGVRSKPRTRHPSETDNLDKWLQSAMEITAGDLRDQLDDGTTNPVWTMRGYTQVLHNWKETKRGNEEVKQETVKEKYFICLDVVYILYLIYKTSFAINFL